MSTTRMTGPESVTAVGIAIAKAKTIDDVPCHPVAAMFPLIEGTEWESFKADVAAQGLLNPIVVDHFGQIVDGRNRAKAIIELGSRGPSARIVALDFGGDDQRVIKYIVSANMERRQLTTSQRTAIAAELTNLGHGGDRRSEQVADLQLDRVTTAKAAETMQVSKSSVGKYKAAKVKEANPVAHAAVKAGKKSAEAAIKETKAKAAKQPKVSSFLTGAPRLPETRKERQEELQKSVEVYAQASGITSETPAQTMPKVRITRVRDIKMPHKPVFLDEIWTALKPYLAELEEQGKKNAATVSIGTVADRTCMICKLFEKLAQEVTA